MKLTIDLNIFSHPGASPHLEDQLNRILDALTRPTGYVDIEIQLNRILDAVTKLETKMATALEDLTTQVTETNTVIGSAVVLIQGLKAALDAAGTNPVALKALSDSLNTSEQALASAVLANTPAPAPAV